MCHNITSTKVAQHHLILKFNFTNLIFSNTCENSQIELAFFVSEHVFFFIIIKEQFQLFPTMIFKVLYNSLRAKLMLILKPKLIYIF